MTNDKRFIAIAGNIGVGKSSLTARLSDHFGWSPFYEAVDDNPYLADFYDDMQRWSFHSQIYFLSRRLRHHKDLLTHPNHVIQDRSVYEDAEIFARNLFEQGQMQQRDYDSYRELYEIMVELLPPPNLLIYLRADINTLITRIEKRGRDFERNIESAYLQDLNRLYEAWIANFTRCPVLIIQANRYDFVENKIDFRYIVDQITDQLQQGQEGS
ncbi:MAG: deoxynucleoside kinase [Chloroflexota bacterium]